MPDAGPEIPRVEELVGEEEHHHDRYGRLVAIATVVTTLIAALVAFAQASSLKLHDRTDSRAEEYGALALQAAAVNRGKAEAQIDRFSLLTQQVRAADNASLFQSYGNASAATRLEAARWNAIATQTEADTAAIAHSQGIAYICAPSVESGCTATDASYSPEQDPNFPNRYMEQTHWSAYELTALRDASNQEADDAEAQFVHYAAALTMLAVAVFLFGYSLTPQGRTRRRLYSRVASGFVVVAGLWALFQALSPVSHPPDAAARAFANAEVDYGVGDYPAAIKEFNRTLKLRPRSSTPTSIVPRRSSPPGSHISAPARMRCRRPPGPRRSRAWPRSTRPSPTTSMRATPGQIRRRCCSLSARTCSTAACSKTAATTCGAAGTTSTRPRRDSSRRSTRPT